MKSRKSRLRYLNDAVDLATSDLAVVEAYNLEEFAGGRVYGSADQDFDIRLAFLRHGEATVTYFEQTGSLVRTGIARNNDISLGVILTGHATLDYGGHREVITPGCGSIQVPGDVYVQSSTDLSGFSIRIPLNSASTLPIRSMSFRDLSNVSRRMAPDTASDLIRLLKFFGQEFDLIHRRGRGDPARQIDVLLGALQSSVQHHIERILGEATDVDDSLVSICRLAIEAIENSPEDRVSTTQMAYRSVCSVRQLYRAFESVLKTRPAEFERYQRLLMARRDIAITMADGDRISQIAGIHGFSNLARFKANYEEAFMESPEETKRKMRVALDRSLGRINEARKSAIS